MAGRPARQVVGLLVLLGLAVDGCSPGRPGPVQAPPSSTPAVTQVLTFQAFDVTGLLPNLVATATVTGACPGGSVVHPGRADAWRCGAAGTSFDPCFANTTGEELACVPDPWSHEVTVLRPAAPLGRAGANRNDPGLPPWFVELGDGSRCGRVAPSTYRCTSGRQVGEPDTTRPVWTVPPLSDEVRTAWY